MYNEHPNTGKQINSLVTQEQFLPAQLQMVQLQKTKLQTVL
jgi:hypothetical protein